ncbi:conserved hypothetical protein [Hymenobacter roseosalivarius DSM 11622]|uniref:DUF2141 domain-containing protein n=1 Tax=Hymenobacter roseosalivarius DSM 11622 TaxID=645990 RepID=A0A1W1VDB9_9BACT|nr:DUF2141 domain-containing protein [Hymenobacter roseosalivarius]SMB91399.1 conserved hypothetical protein [Hymenobacter roseosalivarius DSM 11622]
MVRSFLSITLLQLLAFVSAVPALWRTATTDADVPASHAISGSVANLRNARGTCYVSLYNRKEGFPGKKSVATQKVQLTAKECVFIFDKLPKGDYAIAAYHDENNNGRLDTNFIGLPTEGYAFSNNPRATMGPPSFAEAKIAVHGPRVKVQLAMKY